MKKSNDQLRRSTTFLQGVIDTVRQPLLVLDSTLRVISCNRAFLHDFNLTPEITRNKFLYRINEEQWNMPKLRVLLEEVVNEDKEVADFEIRHEFKNLGQRTLLLNARKLLQREKMEPMILLAIENITVRKLNEASLIKAEKRTATMQLLSKLAHEINNPLQAVANLVVLLQNSTETTDQSRKYATLAEQELARIMSLVRQSLVIETVVDM